MWSKHHEKNHCFLLAKNKLPIVVFEMSYKVCLIKGVVVVGEARKRGWRKLTLVDGIDDPKLGFLEIEECSLY